MKFLNSSGFEVEYYSQFNEVNKESSPFKEIIEKKPLTDFSLLSDDAISFDNIFILQVNVKNAGAIFLLFNKDKWDKEEALSKISPLGELPSNTISDIINKIRSLFQIVAPFNPVASIYSPSGELRIYPDCFATLCNDILTFYLSNEGEIIKASPAKEKTSLSSFFAKYKKSEKKENKNEEPAKEVEEKPTVEKQSEEKPHKEKSKFKFENPIKVIAQDKFHFLFALVATFLIGFTISVAIYDCYLCKAIYIFFFVCALVGSVLNAFIYYDTLKAHKIKSMYSLITAIANLVGVGLSFGGYAIFVNLSKEKPDKEPMFIIIVLIILAVVGLSIAGSFLIKFINNKRKH